MRVRHVCTLCLLIVLTACTGSTSTEPEDGPATTALSAGDRRLVAAAKDVVSFLQGKLAFEEIETASSVTLGLSRAGGGTSKDVGRHLLRDRQNWHVQSPSGMDYSFLPPKQPGELVTRPGKHINCMEYDLASAVDGAAQLPHVGTMIKPEGSDSCLQAWNLTLVFDPKASTPTLIWAVYDQWEW